MNDDIQQLKDRIATTMDVTDFLDILGWELPDLLEVLEDQIFEEHYTRLDRAAR